MKVKYKNVNGVISTALFLLIFSWGLLAIVRSFYNFSKIYSEERSWIFLSDSEKRTRLFGDLYSVAVDVDSKTPVSSRILLLAPGGKTFFLSRYYLYPRRLVYVRSVKEMQEELKKNSFDYLVMFQTSERELNEYDSLSWKINKTPVYSSSAFENKKARLSIYIL